MVGPGPPASPRTAQPAPPSESHSTAQGSQQSGQGNVTGQIDASGWKGVEYTTAVPVGQVTLMGLMLWLSHRREVLRIKQNGKGAYPAPCSSSLKSLGPGFS